MKKLFLLLILLVIPRFAAAQEFRLPTSHEELEDMTAGHRYALLVGVTHYSKESKLTNLQCCVNDVHIIRDQLRKLKFEEPDIRILESGPDVNRLPSRKNILATLDDILSKAKEGDTIFFAFMGHGIHDYICPYDMDLNHLPQTAISVSDVMKRLEKSQATFKWMVVDACRSRNTRDSSAPFHVGEPPKGIVLFQSCAEGQVSYENILDEGHGVFSQMFALALSGLADENKDGELRLTEVIAYTTKETSRYVAETFGEQQYPAAKYAIADFAIKKDLNRPKAMKKFVAAEKFFDSEDYVHAKEQIDAAVALCPDDEDFKRFQKSILRILEIENKRPQNVDKAAMADQYVHAATQSVRDRKYDDALTLMKRALEYQKENTEYPPLIDGCEFLRINDVTPPKEVSQAGNMDGMYATRANLVCGAGESDTSFLSRLLHTAQGRLSRVCERRAKLAIACESSGQKQDKAKKMEKIADIRDKSLNPITKDAAKIIYEKMDKAPFNAAAVALDRALEQRQITLQKLCELISEQIKKEEEKKKE